MERKGIIMKIADQKVIVLTSDRQFLTIPYEAHMRVGSEVIIPLVTQAEKSRFFRSPMKMVGVFVASVLVALEFWQGIPMYPAQRAYAYITIDVNPSVEMAVDGDELVLSARPLNDDAKQLLENTHLTGQHVDQAAAVLANESVKKGYLKAKSEVLVSASRANKDDNNAIDLTQLESKVMNAFHQAVAKDVPIDVEGVIVPEELRDEAWSQGVSAGKYFVYVRARSLGAPVTIDELRSESLTDIAKRYGLDLSRMVQPFQNSGRSGQITSEEPDADHSETSEDPRDGKRQPAKSKDDDSAPSASTPAQTFGKSKKNQGQEYPHAREKGEKPFSSDSPPFHVKLPLQSEHEENDHGHAGKPDDKRIKGDQEEEQGKGHHKKP
jgi:hypothetical protein